MYWVATAIIAAADGPSQEPLVSSDVTELNDATDDANSSAKPFQAAAAASSGPAPGPANISAELISGGNHAKCGFVTNPNYLPAPVGVAISEIEIPPFPEAVRRLQRPRPERGNYDRWARVGSPVWQATPRPPGNCCTTRSPD
ncbi:hypothetical protein MSHI_29960 [Mycobacterium shinjukuense]|uniref:Uncharacterized protein n=1 Tax=Mycobacterium shinjukuense TaxID=398694 RepID=A0A7I7MT43_9MYCO|nr:hypothetical protein MSHI_29960 [Mycobacterium shinjukuense]